MRPVVLRHDDQATGILLSRRCTIPGRATPPIPESESPQWAISALTRVPVSCPPAGMHHQPDGFVDHDQIIVFVDDGERDVLAPRPQVAPAALPGAARRIRAPGTSLSEGVAAPASSTMTRPSRNQWLDARAPRNPEGPRPAPCRGVSGPSPAKTISCCVSSSPPSTMPAKSALPSRLRRPIERKRRLRKNSTRIPLRQRPRTDIRTACPRPAPFV